MIKNKFRGRLLVFEGIDGAGSTTQVRLLNNYLFKNKIKYITGVEPTDGLVGKIIRQILRGEYKVDPATLQLLYTADRADHLAREIVPGLKSAKIVVLDRYAMSTLAYGLLNLEGVWLLELSKNFILPDVTFLVDTPVPVAMKRMSSRKIKELFEKERLLVKVRSNYLKLAKDFGKDVIVLDGRKSEDEIFEEVLKRLREIKII